MNVEQKIQHRRCDHQNVNLEVAFDPGLVLRDTTCWALCGIPILRFLVFAWVIEGNGQISFRSRNTKKSPQWNLRPSCGTLVLAAMH